MKILWILLFAVTAVTVSARHKKEWQKVDLTKIARERPQIFYKPQKPACAKGAGYYRDPQDCHRFIRCVDEYGNGRHFSVFSGRCEPGLVFDENVSACNWPELAAPCSNSPPRLQEVRKPFKPEQVLEENSVSEEKNWKNDQHPQQQEVVPESQVSDKYETQQKEMPVVQEIQVAAQEPIYQDKVEQTFVETQGPFQEQVQEQVFQENVQAAVVQEQFNQENVQSPESQEQVYEEGSPVSSHEGQNIESVQAFEQSAQNDQNVIQTEQQVVYQEQSNQNEVFNRDPVPKQGSTSGFQHVVDQQNQQFQVSQQAQQGEPSQQASQSNWWIPEDKPQYSPPKPSEQIPASDSNQPIFCSEEGFYRHPDNCSQFIRCVKIGAGAFAVHFFECPKQLVFNDKDSACIVADSYSCRSRTKRQASNVNLRCTGEGFFRHPEDCRAFYRCVKSATGSYETHQFSCPANLVFDEEYTTCNWPDKAPPCDSQQQYKPTRKPVKPVQSERTTYMPPSRTTSRSTPKKESRTTTKPRNDFVDESIAQLSNRKRNTQKPKSTTSTYEAGPRCRSPGFYRNDNDCTKFFKCVKKGNNFIRYDLSCPQNFAYDDSTKRCVSQRYVSSCNRNRRPYPPRQDDEETTASPEATSAGSSDSQSGNDASACKKEGYYRNPEDCNKFYRCVDFNGNGEEFVRYDFNCPEGLVFDEENSVCNWPDQSAPCDTSGGGGKGTDGDSSEGGESEGNGESGGPGSENEAEETSAPPEQPSTESVESTSSSSVDSNEEPEGSDKDSSESESNKESGGSGSENECTKEGFYRNPDDCNKFYRCVDFDGEGKEFVRYDFSCPEGLVFDEVNSVCNWPSDSEPCDTRSGGGNEGEDGQDKKSSTEPSPEKESESSGDNQDQNQQTTPSDRGSTADSNPPASSTEDSSQSPTESSNGITDGSRGGGSKGSSGECTEEGFFRDPEDCNKFYRCVDQNSNGEFIKYDFTCPEGLVFDESNSVCNWPDQSAPCDGSSSGKEQGSTSGTGDGDSGSSEATTSSSGSSSEKASESSTASSTTASTVSESSSSTTEKSETTPSESSGSESPSDTSESGSKGSEGECTEEGFFRNPEDCNKFYRCVDYNGDGQQFVKYDFECPEGLVFDEVNSVCNWPDQSPKCEARSDSDANKTTDSGSESSTSQTDAAEQTTQNSAYETTQSPSSTTQSTSGSSTASSDSECTEPGFHRCKDDCSKFYRCVEEDGKLVRYDFKCPDGLIFDDKNKKCDWPSSELTCDTDSSSTTTTSAYESSTSGTSTTSAYESSTSGTSTQSSSSSDSSSKECTEEGFFRNPDDCSKYYRCLDEGDGRFSREDFSCAEDEVFDEEMRYCNRKDLAPPCESTSNSSDSECTEPGFYRSKDDCSKFYRCVEEDGKLVRYDFECPDGLIFDDKNKKCEWPSSEVNCDDSSSTSTTSAYESSSESSKKECTEEGFFRDPDDCSKYYRCLDEGDGTFSREEFSCAEDEVFDEEMRYCNRKDLAPPCDGSQTESTSSSTSSSESQSTTQRSATTTQSTTESSTKGSSSSECNKPGFFRCPEDCTKFYRCVEEDGDMVRYDFQCPDGLIFDEKNEKCDWPSSELTCDTESSTTSSSSTESSQTSGTTSKSGTESSSSGDCTEEGFFRNPDDCSKYYRCIDEGDGTFTREDFACEEDEVFDEEMRYCNRKDLAPPCDGTSSTTESSGGSTSSSSSESESPSGTTSASSGSGECTEEGFHRDPNDCSKFYRCVDFEGDGKSFTRYDFDCPEGLVFDESNDVCNWPSSVPSCESGSKSGGSTSESSSATSGTSASTAASEQTSTTQSEQTSTTSREQTSTTSSGSESTDGTQEQSSTASTSSESETTSSGSTGSRGSGSSDNIECTEEGFFRHPEDCSKFYRCVDFAGTGESYVRYDFDCPEGLVFDEVNSVCNWPNQSPSCESGSRGESDKNEGSSTDSGSTSDSSDNSGTTQSASSTTARDQTTRSATSTTSSDEFRCEEEGYYRHPSDCKKYYECKRDEETGELEKIDCECPDGQVWDNEGWYCNSEELSPPCDNRSSGSSFKCTEEGFFRDPEDCTRYYQCNRTGSGSDEFTSERHQCDDGLVFDQNGRYCNAPELSEPCDGQSSTSSGTTGGDSSKDGGSDGSTSSGSSSGQCTNEGYFRDPEDCTKYYQCTRNEETDKFDKTDYSCPDGRIFDEGSNYCNEPELSEQPCDSSSQPTTSRQSNTESSSTGDSGSTSASGTRRGGGDPECTQEGFFRHPDDCNKFYRCVDFSGSGESFVRYDFDCPEGLHFDEVNSVCNWPTMTPPCESSNRLFFQYKPV